MLRNIAIREKNCIFVTNKFTCNQQLRFSFHMDLANTSEIQFPRKYIARDKPRKSLLLCSSSELFCTFALNKMIFSSPLCDNYMSYK